MASPRILTTASILLLTLPALLPGAAATLQAPFYDHGGAIEWAGGGCSTTYTDWLNSGRITIVKRGTYAAEGYGIDGCKGNGCDDGMEGWFDNGAGTVRRFHLHEVRTYAGCTVSCWVDTSSGRWSRYEVEGALYVDTYENLVNFRCGTEGTSTFLFKGQIIWCGSCAANIDPDAAVPALETGDLTI